MNPHLKLAYDHGVQKALEDAGLTKEAYKGEPSPSVPVVIGALSGVAGVDVGQHLYEKAKDVPHLHFMRGGRMNQLLRRYPILGPLVGGTTLGLAGYGVAKGVQNRTHDGPTLLNRLEDAIRDSGILHKDTYGL